MRLKLAVAAGLLTAAAWAAEPPTTRLLFQDHSVRTVRWADVLEAADGTITLGPVADVPGFPKLDPEKRMLAQMRVARGNLVGVRDDDEGTDSSGWVMVASGVKHSERR